MHGKVIIDNRFNEYEWLFKSFWIAGFEGATHINRRGERLDMIAAVQHDVQVEHDYALLHNVGIQTARDGIRWHLIDRGTHFDFTSLDQMFSAARKHQLQIIWSLCHYGWPDDLDLFSGQFVERFVRYCKAVARYIADLTDQPQFFIPVNEISFFAWAVGHAACFYPYARGRDAELKANLVRATIAGIEALWEVDRRTRICLVDPIFHVVVPRNRPDLAQATLDQRNSQFEAWDMIAGSTRPELGGHPRYLDIIGVNYYAPNQWEHPAQRIPWEQIPRDERWMPAHLLVAEVYHRYRRPIFMAETSHVGDGRAAWLREISAEMYLARVRGIPLEGICLYPILDRPDWENNQHWHNSGLFDLPRDEQGVLRRVLNQEYAAALRDCQAWLAEQYCY